MERRDRYTSLFTVFFFLAAALACSLGNTDKEPATSNQPSASSNENKSDTSKKADDSKKAEDASGVHVESLQLARDDGHGNSGATVSAFKPSDNPIHFVAQLNKIQSGTKVKMVLTAVDAGNSKNEQVGAVEKTTTAFENQLDAHWQYPQDWPAGRYKIEAYINDKLDKTVDFDIE
jgi:hypothetical protein